MITVAIRSFGKLFPGHSDNMQIMTDLWDDANDALDLLGEFKYMFAIGEIDPRIGKINVEQVSWPSTEYGSGNNKTKEVIPMVECSLLTQNSGHNQEINPDFNPYDNYMRSG